MRNFGKVQPGKTLYVPFDTFAGSTGALITITGFAVGDIKIYKNGGTTERASTSGYTLLDTDGVDFDSITGLQGFSIDLSDNTTAGFFVSGAHYDVAISTITVDSQTMSFWVASFDIGEDGAILDTTIATLTSQTSFTITNGPADNHALEGCAVVVRSPASSVQVAIGLVSAYAGSTKGITLIRDPNTFTMAVGNNISFMASSAYQLIGAAGVFLTEITQNTNNLPSDPADESNIIAATTSILGRIGSPSISLTADIAAAKADTAAIKLKTDNLPSDPADASDVLGSTNAIYLRIGAPAGASISADLAAAKSDTAAIKVKTDNLPASPAAVGSSMVVSDKTGFKLASDGLDSIATTPPTALASNFREMVVQTWRRWFKKATKNSTQLKTFADDDATVITTQTISDDSTTQTQGKGT